MNPDPINHADNPGADTGWPKQTAIKHAATGAGPDWLAADAAVRRVAGQQQLLVSDDVWDELRDQPREPRTMGAIMQKAAKAGVIVATSEWRESLRITNHGRPQRVWRP